MKIPNTIPMLALLAITLIAVAVIISPLPSASANEDFAELALLVTYEDGTTQFYTKPSSNLPQSLAILVGGNPISSIQIALKATPTWTSPGTTLKSWSISGAASGSVRDTAGNVIVPVASGAPLSKSGDGTLASGSEVQVLSSSYLASNLQGLWTGWAVNTDYKYVWHLDSFSMTLDFNDNTSVSRSATAADLSLTFRYQSSAQFTGLTVTWSVSTS